MTTPTNLRPGNAPTNTPIFAGAPAILNQNWMGWFTRVASLFASASNVTQITVGASVFNYTNTSTNLVQVFIVGGTVTAVSFVRNGTAYSLGPVATNVILSSQDSVQVQYSAAPTMYVSPL